MPNLRDLRNLPDEVLQRISLGDQEARIDGFDIDIIRRAGGRQEPVIAEARRLTATSNQLEVRDSDEGNPTLDGYATVYEVTYDVFGGPPFGWSEKFADGACDKSVRERDDVRLLINHRDLPLARTMSKTLVLESDDVGLRCESELDGDDPDVMRIVPKMRRGDLDEMSMAFRVLRQEWNGDYTMRTIIEVEVLDVSVVTFPANTATVVQLRGELEPEEEPEPTGMSIDLANAIRSQVSLTR